MTDGVRQGGKSGTTDEKVGQRMRATIDTFTKSELMSATQGNVRRCVSRVGREILAEREFPKGGDGPHH